MSIRHQVCVVWTYFNANSRGISLSRNCSRSLRAPYRNLVLCDRASSVQRCKQPQDAKTFSFFNLFKSAQHVSGEKFDHSQEHVLTVCTAFGKMYCRGGALYRKLYIRSKSVPEDGRICRPKEVGPI
jgi:hypothetical protein